MALTIYYIRIVTVLIVVKCTRFCEALLPKCLSEETGGLATNSVINI